MTVKALFPGTNLVLSEGTPARIKHEYAYM